MTLREVGFFARTRIEFGARVLEQQSWCCLGEPGLAQTQLFEFSKPRRNESLSSAEEVALKFRRMSL